MTKESVLRLIEICQSCGVSYIPQNGEICDCIEEEEPVVRNWDSLGWREKVELSDDAPETY